jgi:hypothetical protein
MKKGTNLFKDRERYPFRKIITTDLPQIISIKGSKEFYVNSLQKKRIILNVTKPSKSDPSKRLKHIYEISAKVKLLKRNPLVSASNKDPR